MVGAAGDVRVAVEPKPATAVATTEQAVQLADRVDGLGVLLDTGHAFAAGEDPAGAVELLGDRLVHVHLGDAALGAGDDDLPCGRVHDFGAVVAALDAVGFRGATLTMLQLGDTTTACPPSYLATIHEQEAAARSGH